MLAAWRKRTRRQRGGLKYYLMGVFATGVMLYGMSLIFGGTGSTNLAEIGTAIGKGVLRSPSSSSP
jgi:NADH-quinone oxidoreductase subunit N